MPDGRKARACASAHASVLHTASAPRVELPAQGLVRTAARAHPAATTSCASATHTGQSSE